MKGKLRVLLRLNFQVYRRQKQARNIRTGTLYIYIGGKKKARNIRTGTIYMYRREKQARNIRAEILYIERGDKQGILE